MHVRHGRTGDLPLCQDIERAAGAAFRDLGMEAIADDEPPTLDVLDGYRRAGRLWVAADDLTDRPLACLLAARVDGCTHIEQLSVHPDSARRGIGRALLGHAAAAEGGRPLTLTTFSEVPWNAPYYERIGFRRLAESELTPGLKKIQAAETELGLHRWPRVCMRRAG
ncbi:GNAT family N-acetyltransferase [Streptomyces gobiensis]|uniref:GNAT family N-acetyltransferase n=1 Tax=Streptomyces gobiensis TaxID=2875706 RepID=UPI001E41C6A5|nr:GNAT family N-acetyltransferase [Streptomyces gobiensis]UGY94718.1 GNAT family N-acetyltransferase [Streptomyces gobiensis]